MNITKTICRKSPAYVSALGTGLLFIGQKMAVILAVVKTDNRAGGFSDFVLRLKKLINYFSFYTKNKLNIYCQ